jgi:hypothetical protein
MPETQVSSRPAPQGGLGKQAPAKTKAPVQPEPEPLEFQQLLATFNTMLGRTQSGRMRTKWG